MIKKLLILITLATLACAQVSAIGNPGAGYVVFMNNPHEDYQPVDGFRPSWASELPIFIFVNFIMTLASIVSMVFIRELPILAIIVLALYLWIMITYNIPQIQKFTNTTQTLCEIKANGNTNVSC